MRVLVINSMFVHEMYRRCADELGALPNMDLTVLMPDSWQLNNQRVALDPLRVNAPYRTVVGRAGWKGYENRGFYFSGVVRAFKQARPEVVFLMEEPFSLFAAEILFVRRQLGLRIPIVFFTWNNLSLERFDYRPSVLYRALARATLPQFDRAVTANSDAIPVLRRAGFTRPATTIGYGVETSKFSRPLRSTSELRESLSIQKQDHVVGFVGRLKVMKGVDLLVEAFAQLVRAGKKDIKLLLLGGGEDKQRIFSQIHDLGIDAYVRHVPTVAQERVPDYMQVLDTLVLPSRRVGMWAEQFGRVLIEAMAAGKVVLGSTSGAIPEVIGDAGFTFQENDAEDLRVQLERAIDLSQEDRLDVANRARMRATDFYSWAAFADRAAHELWAAKSDGGSGT